MILVGFGRGIPLIPTRWRRDTTTATSATTFATLLPFLHRIEHGMTCNRMREAIAGRRSHFFCGSGIGSPRSSSSTSPFRFFLFFDTRL